MLGAEGTNQRKRMGVQWRLEQDDEPESNGVSLLYDGSLVWTSNNMEDM